MCRHAIFMHNITKCNWRLACAASPSFHHPSTLCVSTSRFQDVLLQSSASFTSHQLERENSVRGNETRKLFSGEEFTLKVAFKTFLQHQTEAIDLRGRKIDGKSAWRAKKVRRELCSRKFPHTAAADDYGSRIKWLTSWRNHHTRWGKLLRCSSCMNVNSFAMLMRWSRHRKGLLEPYTSVDDVKTASCFTRLVFDKLWLARVEMKGQEASHTSASTAIKNGEITAERWVYVSESLFSFMLAVFMVLRNERKTLLKWKKGKRRERRDQEKLTHRCYWPRSDAGLGPRARQIIRDRETDIWWDSS